ncbi:16S rRNA (cytidine(1402)-2'-O)-methyltransferase [Sphingomicrobium astaxanthinifaciens]|uniref:16S rRNA (cytidine(1402)-2'-O)-methyltransferase n=1 Tax=Sphingomicrobium astaxanthinifaciens TaxID=1227949 RepID=UPI001FCA670B|nr:16S rRNA (cytidine(1402)-2'-O)-methyltransferase [Sphingomicrobium astaxanthinifaciens]MCJ7422003.1 16S rRNA (cytidine(1402)-2'-O)-methyltransferase [Sphingomicrobium astaxanthinifaciens]
MKNLEISPGLYIVATPIGNLSDLSARAGATIAAADLLLVEDSRVTGKLLAHLGLKKPMRPYHDHSKEADREAILAMLADKVVVLVSDAGTPLISDPGYKLVHAARARGLPVGAVPGPSAPTMALTLSGLPTDRYLFAGFIPSKDKARADLFEELAGLRATLVFFETGPRLAKSLAAAAEVLGNRPAAVARELTKMFEEVATGTLEELGQRYADTPPKGEIVLVIGPPGEDEAPDDAAIDAAIDEALESLSPSRAAKEVATRFGLKKNDVYARVQQRVAS